MLIHGTRNSGAAHTRLRALDAIRTFQDVIVIRLKAGKARAIGIQTADNLAAHLAIRINAIELVFVIEAVKVHLDEFFGRFNRNLARHAYITGIRRGHDVGVIFHAVA